VPLAYNTPAAVAGARRFAVDVPVWHESPAAQLGVLASVGALTALARGMLDLRLGIPGHSIVLVVVPLTFGLACAPRRGAGGVMGGSALATAIALNFAGVRGLGAGAMTSLALTAAVLESALHLARSGRGVYLWCTGAGIASNLGAFLVRLVVKSFAAAPVDVLKPVQAWWPMALGTYVLCGAASGLLGAGLFFRLGRARRGPAMLGVRELACILLAALGLAFALSRAGSAAPRPARIGVDFSERVGRALGHMAASRLSRGDRVVIVSGEFEGTDSAHRQAEVRGLRRELKAAGIRPVGLLRPSAGDLDEHGGGAGSDLMIRAAGLDPACRAVICLAGLPARVPPGFADAFGDRLLLAYEQNGSVARRWLQAELHVAVLFRAADGSAGKPSLVELDSAPTGEGME